MVYCDVCECDVPSHNLQKHFDGTRHDNDLSDDDFQNAIEYCDACDCDVFANNWQGHIGGELHDANSTNGFRDNDDDLDSDGFGEDEHEKYKVVSRGCLVYTQDSIKNSFQSRTTHTTTLDEGIANLLWEIPEAYRTARRWGADFSPKHLVGVFPMGGGKYAVHNHRTLHCYEHAGFRRIPVKVLFPSKTKENGYEISCYETAPCVRPEPPLPQPPRKVASFSFTFFPALSPGI